MTTFFNKKEEVIEVKLTQYGKHKLAQGRLKPAYYSFFDEGVVYDSEYAGFTEAQNDADVRIQSTTPSLKSQHVYTGIETSASFASQIVRQAISDQLANSPTYATQNDPYFLEDLQPSADKNGFLRKPLGTSALVQDKLPAWRVSPLIGEMCSSEQNLSASDGIQNIPQINITVDYETFVARLSPDEDFVNIAEIDSEVYSDGTYVVIREHDILLSIEEENVDFNKENSDIEVFELSGPEPMRQLTFTDRTLISETQFSQTDFTTTNVEYYLEINADSEVEAAMVRKANIKDLVSPVLVDNEIGVSTRKYLIKDLYEPEPELCD